MSYHWCDLEVEVARQPNLTAVPNAMHYHGIIDDGGNFYFPEEVRIPAGSIVLVHRTGAPHATPAKLSSLER